MACSLGTGRFRPADLTGNLRYSSERENDHGLPYDSMMSESSAKSVGHAPRQGCGSPRVGTRPHAGQPRESEGYRDGDAVPVSDSQWSYEKAR